jgi:hypothetical protein
VLTSSAGERLDFEQPHTTSNLKMTVLDVYHGAEEVLFITGITVAFLPLEDQENIENDGLQEDESETEETVVDPVNDHVNITINIPSDGTTEEYIPVTGGFIPSYVGFILPHSNTRALTDTELINLNLPQLILARNEIYARHGRQFFDQSLQAHFDAQPWYRPSLPLGVEPTLTQLEHSNVALIQLHEARRAGPVSRYVPGSGFFILPYSSSRALTDAELNGLSAHELMLARNEIFARHGRRFFDQSIQNHFNAQPWYQPRLPLGVEPTLTPLEQSNVAIIQTHEARR